MTRDELIALLSERFCANFADTLAARVTAADAVGLLYEVATARHEALPAAVRNRFRFRSAYVLERIAVETPAEFAPLAGRFCRTDFPACRDASARRHFSKIMALLLPASACDAAALDRIAETAAEWAVAPGTKVAVQVWCVEILKYCRGRVPWVDEVWGDLLASLGSTPAIASRMRSSWKK